MDKNKGQQLSITILAENYKKAVNDIGKIFIINNSNIKKTENMSPERK